MGSRVLSNAYFEKNFVLLNFLWISFYNHLYIKNNEAI